MFRLFAQLGASSSGIGKYDVFSCSPHQVRPSDVDSASKRIRSRAAVDVGREANIAVNHSNGRKHPPREPLIEEVVPRVVAQWQQDLKGEEHNNEGISHERTVEHEKSPAVDRRQPLGGCRLILIKAAGRAGQSPQRLRVLAKPKSPRAALCRQ